MKKEIIAAVNLALVFTLMLFVFSNHAFAISPDSYESDDNWRESKVIFLNPQIPNLETPNIDYEIIQTHNFHFSDDEDWVKFSGQKGETYEIRTMQPDANCDTAIQIYTDGGQPLRTEYGDIIEEVNYYPEGFEESTDFKCPDNGIYYVKIRQASRNFNGSETGYKLSLARPMGAFAGLIYGKVIPAQEAEVSTGFSKVRTLPDGSYIMPHRAGSFWISAFSSSGVKSDDIKIDVPEFGVKMVDFEFPVPPPINGNIKIRGSISYEGIPLCAMVLANGQYMFTCDEKGKYELDVVKDQDGKITLFGFSDDLSFYKKVFEPSDITGSQIEHNIYMSPASPYSRHLSITREFSYAATRPNWVKISGMVHDNGVPLCAMVLANGQYMFSCNGDGRYEMEVPLDQNGEITLFGFCDGYQPFKETLRP